MIHTIFYNLLSYVVNLFSISSVQIDGYIDFNKSTDAVFSFDGQAGKVHLFSSDDSVYVELNEATNANSFLVPKNSVVERIGGIKTVYAKGLSGNGTLHISGDMMSSGKGDIEIQDTYYKRKI